MSLVTLQHVGSSQTSITGKLTINQWITRVVLNKPRLFISTTTHPSFPSGEPGVSGNFWGSHEGWQDPFRPSGRNMGLPWRHRELRCSPGVRPVPRWPLELLRGSQAPRRAVCGTRGSLRACCPSPPASHWLPLGGKEGSGKSTWNPSI